MDIAHLSSFYEVVQRGSFSAAADALGVSKGMLSRHVSALESALNAQLLQRTTRRLSLTEAGRTLYVQAGQIAALARQAEQDIQALTEEDSGRLRFTCPVSTGDRMVSELLARFAEICPGVEVELNFTNAMIDMSQGRMTSPCAPWIRCRTTGGAAPRAAERRGGGEPSPAGPGGGPRHPL